MSPNTWGPPTWMFLHTLATKIKEDSFPLIGNKLVLSIMSICYHLPCPECSQHAKKFWSNVKIGNIQTKNDLINILFVFHNLVNKRKGYPPFNNNNLHYYNSRNLIHTFNQFSRNFNTKGNISLINESFHRNIMMTALRKWMMGNIVHFDI